MLARAERLVSAADYRRVVRRGRRASSPLMTAYAVAGERDDSWRFGFIVSKAVGNAVVRNRVRRRLKAISFTVDRAGSGLGTVDVVFRAHPAAASATFSDLHDDVISLVARVSAPGHGRTPVSDPGRKG